MLWLASSGVLGLDGAYPVPYDSIISFNTCACRLDAMACDCADSVYTINSNPLTQEVADCGYEVP
jgi:hypothetical protein